MPKATASREGVRFDLKELPEGYVVLRKLSYGEMLARRNLGMGVTAPFKRDQRDNESVDLKLDLSQEEVRLYEFSHMILDHNLEDENGRKLNMGDRKDISNLDPKIALEIEGHINELNLPDDETPLPASSGSPSATENGSTTQT